MKKDKEEAKIYILEKLKRGDGVIVSFASHFIRIVSCDDNGYIYDDPYGSYIITDTKDSKRTWTATNETTTETGVGGNNIRKWSDFDTLTESIKLYIEYYHEK